MKLEQTATDKVIELMKTTLIPRVYAQRGIVGAAYYLWSERKLTWDEFQDVRKEYYRKDV
ncbi:MAG: hypothetical protein NC218_08025 [Acetobacter sp.]|nr:hypothetical protein [Acetobacter sp.]